MSDQIDRHAPIGFFHLALDFHVSGKLATEAHSTRSLRFGHVPYYLYTHSIELALKAYLRASEVTETELRKNFRHGLVDLLAKCEELELRFRKPKRTQEVVRRLGELTYDQAFRYFYGGTASYPELHEVRDANERILDAVRPKCTKSVTDGRKASPNYA